MIYKKLLEFQKLDIKVEKNGDNPYFNSTYVTLNEVLAKVKKPLNDMGVVIVQQPGFNGLGTKLLDTEDDTFIECFMTYVDATTAQKLGSANTYLRRYSLVTLLGLEDVDDDGNTASEPIIERPRNIKTKPAISGNVISDDEMELLTRASL